ncbi:MAG TPA: 3-oxoadipyl-CoA thiolase, partial [Anaeromyxobacteraceae bacterium]|nr:3-oxoadipyl-CoA thiolase [Anaeromyxobacteraceae bacterium]
MSAAVEEVSSMPEAWIIDAVRTPIGRVGGQLAGVRPDDLAAVPLAAVLARTGVPASEIEDVLLGCANQGGEDSRNVARMAALLAGLPESVPGVTVNRLCVSGLEAVAQAARAISAGDGHVYLAGGVESMSRAPWAMARPERAYPRGNVTLFDTALGWRWTNPRLEALGHTDSLGQTAENLAVEGKIGREAQDRFALASHRKAVA